MPNSLLSADRITRENKVLPEINSCLESAAPGMGKYNFPETFKEFIPYSRYSEIVNNYYFKMTLEQT